MDSPTHTNRHLHHHHRNQNNIYKHQTPLRSHTPHFTMSNTRGLRRVPNHHDVVEKLHLQWPSDAFRPLLQRTQVSVIDCLAILYRSIYSSLSRGSWPLLEPGEDLSGQVILQCFWADFGHMEEDHVALRDQLRQAALAEI